MLDYLQSVAIPKARNIIDKSDSLTDEEFVALCVPLLKEEHQSADHLAMALIDRIYDLTWDSTEDPESIQLEFEDIDGAVKDGVGYIYPLFSLGEKELAVSMMKDVANALGIVCGSGKLGKAERQFVERSESDLRGFIDSEEPKKWFES